MITIRVLAVLCADDDGAHGGAHALADADIAQFFERTDPYAGSAGIRFRCNGALDVVRRESTLLNQDWTIPPRLRVDFTRQDRPFPVADQEAWAVRHDTARSDYAARRRGRLVVFFRSGTRLAGGPGAWSLAPWQGAFSGAEHEFVAFPHGLSEPNLFAHEVGHFLHLPHTAGSEVTLTEDEKGSLPAHWDLDAAARQAVADILIPRLRGVVAAWVAAGNPLSTAWQALDYDRRTTLADPGPALLDTPADPGPQLMTALGHADDDDSVEIPLDSAGHQSLVLSPDRHNVMSYYFRNSLTPKGYTEDQRDRIHWALGTSRSHLQLRDHIPRVPLHILRETSWPTLITHVVATTVLGEPTLVSAYSRQTGRLAVHRLEGRELTETAAFDFGDWTHVAGYDLGLDRYLLAYHADTGAARFSTLHRDGTGIDHRGTAAWQAGWTRVVALGSRGWNRDHLLVYDAQTGQVRIDALSDGGGSRNRWDGSWSPGWTTIEPYQLGMDRWRLFLHRGDTGVVHLDAIEDPAERPRTIHEETWDTGSVRAMAYPTSQFAEHRRGRMLVYRPTSGAATFHHLADDEITQATEMSFAPGWSHFLPTFLTNQFEDGEGMLAYRAASGDLHVDRLL
ncbi:hypothetical protein [Agromyces sp. SYSU T00194]|uniref:hypothetical protein n=1 Tax=Agromyces chitinivorans TaxID=3158560 RepID=UPI0033992538